MMPRHIPGRPIGDGTIMRCLTLRAVSNILLDISTRPNTQMPNSERLQNNQGICYMREHALACEFVAALLHAEALDNPTKLVSELIKPWQR